MIAGGTSERHENPPERLFIILPLVVLLIFLIVGIVLAMDFPILGIFMILLGVAFFIAGSSRELWFRPRSISYLDEGILLSLPCNRKRIVKWETIVQVYVSDGDTSTLTGRLKRTGGIEEKNRIIPVGLTYELAVLTREEHFRRFGRYPSVR